MVLVEIIELQQIYTALKGLPFTLSLLYTLGHLQSFLAVYDIAQNFHSSSEALFDIFGQEKAFSEPPFWVIRQYDTFPKKFFIFGA